MKFIILFLNIKNIQRKKMMYKYIKNYNLILNQKTKK